MAINVREVLHMKRGTGDNSYAKSSYIQKQVLLLTKSIKEEAISQFYCKEQPTTLCIADLGCSSAELNNLSVVSDLVATVEKVRRKLKHGPQDYQIHLNDLPGNDFNIVFRSVASFNEELKQKMGDGFGHCFVNGVPGSFYGRLFPINSLHFVHSSYSLMWLSQVPEGIEDNKKNIYIARTSPPHVLKAYYEQFQKDFSMFLRCRSKEIVPGGRMVLTMLGRKTSEPYSKESCYMWEFLAMALNDMVTKGLIEEDKLNTFNLPQYPPSAAELEFLVEREGSFTLNKLDVSEVSWKRNNLNNGISSKALEQYEFAKCMRSVAEPLLISHFGETIIDEVFQRFKQIVHDSMTIDKNVFINVTIALTKEG